MGDTGEDLSTRSIVFNLFKANCYFQEIGEDFGLKFGGRRAYNFRGYPKAHTVVVIDQFLHSFATTSFSLPPQSNKFWQM